MDTKKLALLLEAVNIGSLKKAADKLNYTQSGLIYLINSLEEEMGVQLLNRTSRGISMTPEGKMLEPFIQKVVDCEEELVNKLREIHEDGTRKLRIGSWPIYACYYLPVAIRNYLEDYPENDIKVRVGIMEEMIKLLEEDEVELIIGTQVKLKNSTWIHLMDYEIYAAMPAHVPFPDGYAVSFEELKDYSLIYSDYNNISEAITEQFSLDKVKKIEVSSCDGSALLRMVEENLGIAFLSEMYLNECPDTIKMFPMNPPIIRELGITMKEKKSKDPLIKSFIPYVCDFHEKNKGRKKVYKEDI